MQYIYLSVVLLISVSGYSQSLYKEKLTKDYFDCKIDTDCTLVSGWCSYFTINKAKLTSYKKIPNNEKNPNTCPPGWVPMEMPQPICLKKVCSKAGEKSGV